MQKIDGTNMKDIPKLSLYHVTPQCLKSK